MSMRDEVESTIKALKLNHSRIFEVSKIKDQICGYHSKN
jgi:hypothetical protein